MRVAAWMWGAGLLLPIGGVAGIFLWPGSNVSAPVPLVAAGPIAQITAPVPGFKLREGRTMAVRVRVEAGDQPLQSWSLKLSGPGHPDEQLASGVLPVDDQPVAQVAADDLTLGEQYQLVLDATDTAEATAEARLEFLVPDPQYTLIPLEPGNFSQAPFEGLSVDASGTTIAFGGTGVKRLNVEVSVLNSPAAILKSIFVPLASTEGQKLSADGLRFFFYGISSASSSIDYVVLAPGVLSEGPPTSSALFTVDTTGNVIAYQSVDPAIPPPGGGSGGSMQYFLYNTDSQTARQITRDPEAVVYSNGDLTACPQTLATTPLISGDGTTVVLITRASFGLAPTATGDSCHVFTYDVARDSLRYVRSFPPQTALDTPKLSDDGRWLSFIETHVIPQGVRRDFGALLDLQTGDLTDPLGGVVGDPTFDAVISGDASIVVVSTTADLDPRVGNVDRNFEFFAYDVAANQFAQISDTTGGISGGQCERFRPSVNADARVVLFSLGLASVGSCQVTAQRNGADDLYLRRVRALRKRPGNHAPVLRPINNVRALAGETLILQFSANDADGDAIVFFAQMVGGLDVPPGSQITDNHDGTATFTWSTLREQAGLYRLRVAAFDEGGGESFTDVSIALCAQVVDDATLPDIVNALFDSHTPVPCQEADRNQDGVLSAGDIIQAAIADY